MNDRQGLLDLFDRVVAEAAPILPPPVTAQVAAIARQARKRLTFPEELLVVGLLGGTGSGKSSLLNALAGAEISPSGALRPTTARALAWRPAGGSISIDRALEAIGVVHVVEHHFDLPLVVIDMPDLDSLVTSHRHEVEELAPYLDLAIWVLDPEKYRDRILHADWLRPLAGHGHGFRFVINQIDRLAPDDLELLQKDLRSVLAADGIESPVIWATAADPEAGPPIGIEEVWAGIDQAIDQGSQRPRQTMIELRRAATLLTPYLEPVEFQRRWNALLGTAGAAANWDGEETRRSVQEFVDELFPNQEIVVDEDVAQAAAASDRARTLDLTLGRRLRDLLRPRARAKALLVELELELNRAEGEE
ncbi:MAG TPA: dynamin family protein [Acidimicrobiia bacterium]|nr:dynamin family protein [Acidimicrobiia bacterium]